VWSSYKLTPGAAIGASLLTGSIAGAASTVACSDVDVGMFPLSGGALGTLVGAGVGSVVFGLAEGQNYTEETGWGIAGFTLGGTALGAMGGMLLPREWDPLLNKELAIFPPTIAALPSYDGRTAVPGVMLAGNF
jgi:hypothetical protein